MENKNRTLAQQAISALLFLAIIASLGWLSTRFKIEADWTSGNRNTLTEPSRKLLASMPDPIKFIAFVYPTADIRREVENRTQRYQRFKEDVSLEFIDPATQPQKVKEYNVSASGEVVIEYQGRRESLKALSEQTVTAALQRLASSGERWVVFLEGHGERSINERERDGYSDFAQALRDKGIKVRALNLVTDPRVPDNASVLVLGAPGKPLLEGEQKLVLEYLDRGGSLLWLADPEGEPGAPALALALGVEWLKGAGILLDSAALGLPPFVYVTTQYPPNAVTKDFAENALFPLVRGLKVQAANGWGVEPLLTTSDQAWLETGDLNGEIALDEAKGDSKGPLTIGVTMTRDAREEAKSVDEKTPANLQKPAADKPSRQQRVAVIGDSDFLSNAYYGQLGNSALGMNLAQWLSSRDAQLNIEVPKAPDTMLLLPSWASLLIGAGFVLLLPLALLSFGVARWTIRRRR